MAQKLLHNINFEEEKKEREKEGKGEGGKEDRGKEQQKRKGLCTLSRATSRGSERTEQVATNGVSGERLHEMVES